MHNSKLTVQASHFQVGEEIGKMFVQELSNVWIIYNRP